MDYITKIQSLTKHQLAKFLTVGYEDFILLTCCEEKCDQCESGGLKCKYDENACIKAMEKLLSDEADEKKLGIGAEDNV